MIRRLMSAQTALLAATALHAGFQLTVTTLVYPALARVPADQWMEAHLAHSRAITPLVAVVYGSLAVTGAWVLLSRPGGWSIVALSAVATAVLVTAFVAAPAHSRLGRGHDRQTIKRLLRADKVRTACAVIALAGALAASQG
jgi:hypothetical protein